MLRRYPSRSVGAARASNGGGGRQPVARTASGRERRALHTKGQGDTSGVSPREHPTAIPSFLTGTASPQSAVV